MGLCESENNNNRSSAKKNISGIRFIFLLLLFILLIPLIESQSLVSKSIYIIKIRIE